MYQFKFFQNHKKKKEAKNQNYAEWRLGKNLGLVLLERQKNKKDNYF